MTKKDEMMVDSDVAYLNHAAMSPMPKSSYNILLTEIQNQAKSGNGTLTHKKQQNTWEEARVTLANLVGGKKEGVVLTTNTASGLHIVADGFHHLWQAGANIVMPEVEFTTNSYIWQAIAKRYGLEIRTIPYRTKDLLRQDWEAKVDHNTILIATSLVQFTDGYKCDVEFLSQLVHDHGGYISVDAIQALGAVPFNVQNTNVDFVAAGGYKWLLGPMGTGFLYIKPDLLEKNILDSILVGWHSDENYMMMKHHEFIPWRDARRYQQSLDPKVMALTESVKTLLRWGIEDNFQSISNLLNYLIDGVAELSSFEIASAMDLTRRSGIVRIESSHRLEQSMIEYLQLNNVFVSLRDGGLRIAPHAYNTTEDINMFLTTLKQWEKAYL